MTVVTAAAGHIAIGSAARRAQRVIISATLPVVVCRIALLPTVKHAWEAVACPIATLPSVKYV